MLSVASGAQPHCLAISADGERLAASSGDSVWLWIAGANSQAQRAARASQWSLASAQQHLTRARECLSIGDQSRAEFHLHWAQRRWDDCKADSHVDGGPVPGDIEETRRQLADLMAAE